MTTHVGYLQELKHNAEVDRRINSMLEGRGCLDHFSFAVSAGPSMGVTVSAGRAFVMASQPTETGLYYVENDAPVVKTVANAHATLPRIDLLVLVVWDGRDGRYESSLEIFAGTATSGATLANRTGAQPIGDVMASYSCIPLADILVPAAAGSITTVRDMRFFNSLTIPSVVTAVGATVVMEPALYSASPTVQLNSGTPDLQLAVPVFLRAPIYGATKLRWQYKQGTTAMTTQYAFNIHDSSGFTIAGIFPTSFTGAANSVQSPSITLADATGAFVPISLEKGYYWVSYGYATSASGSVLYQGVDAGGQHGHALYSQMYKTNLPTTMTKHIFDKTWTDSSGAASINLPDVPVCALTTS